MLDWDRATHRALCVHVASHPEVLVAPGGHEQHRCLFLFNADPAAVTASGELPGGLGAHAGAGLGIGVLPRVRLVLEARGFVLPEGTIEWDPDASLASRELASRLDPIRIRPAFFQATAAVALAF